jgi:hypothetical protein
MKTPTTLFFLTAFAFSGSGCVGTGPNTQQGAVSGAALGALAGAIIGNNSGGNGASGAAIGAVAGAVMGGTLGNAEDHRRGTIYGSEAEATSQVVVPSVPPTPTPRQEVVVVQPDPEAIWIPGYWEYEPSGYVWITGHWEVPPRHHRHYVPPHWTRHRQGGYVYVRGHWRH